MDIIKYTKPRPYQFDHVNDIIRKVVQHRTVCAQLATGGGKTVEFSMISSRYINKTGKSVLILVHRKELLNQTKKTLYRMYGLTAGLIMAGTTSMPKRQVYIGMVESVARRQDYLNEVGLVIIDECHNASFNKMHSIFTDELIIGFTATPKSSSKKNPINKYYSTISVCKADIPDLIKTGYLSQNITRCPEEIVETAKLSILAGEYDLGQMGMEFSKPKYVLNTVKSYLKYSKGKKAICFNVNVEHSLEVTNCFEHFGVNVKHVDGNTPDSQREEVFKWFKETEDAVLCNVGITTMGFDEPTIQTIIVNRATMSMPLWLQMCGRGSRIIDADFIAEKQHEYPYELKEKNLFTIIDMGGNYVPHGDWCEPRDWQYIFENPEREGRPGVAPTKMCPSCRGLVHAATYVCKLIKSDGEMCLHIFDRKKFIEDEETMKLVVITKNMDIYEMIEKHNHNHPYFPFYEIGRQSVKLLKDQRRNIPTHEAERVFNACFEKIKDWHRIAFPKEAFNEAYHLKMARLHFYKEMKKVFEKAN